MKTYEIIKLQNEKKKLGVRLWVREEDVLDH